MTALKAFVFVAMSVSLAACAGAPNRPLPSNDIDGQKVALVNQWAEAHGAKLIWLHYPTRNAARQSD